MAAPGRSLVQQLEAEVQCPLCLEPLAEPLLTQCGHSFCGSCLAPLLAPPGPAACPLCRAPLLPGSLRPNRALGALAGLAAALGAEERRPRCPEHSQALRLFCLGCCRPLCPLCPHPPAADRQPPSPRGPELPLHRVLPAEEAAAEIREMLKTNLVFLQKEKEEWKPEGENESDGLMVKVALEQQKLHNTFEQLHQFLRVQEEILLAQFHQTHDNLDKQHQDYVSSVTERKSLLNTLITEIRKKCNQDVDEFLMDIDKTLSSCEAAKAPILESVSPELQRTVKSLLETSQLIMDAVDEFRVNLLSKVDRERVKVTLDPETLSSFLTLSNDCRTVQVGHGQEELPDTPKRFTGSPSVLGCQGFTAGRHYWELEVGDGESWAVGVAVESVQRKDSLSVAMGKIWALRLDWDGRYTALHVLPNPLVLEKKPRRIRVHLDYEAGRVTFYNAENMGQILQFKASFSEKVFPYFWLWSPETYIKLC